MDNPRREIEASKWNTRGWTYQEFLLSRRCLVFTDTQIYFQCLSSYYIEGLANYRESSQFWDLRAFPRTSIDSTTDAIYDRLEDYYKRELSFKTDIINGFSGVFQAFSKVQQRNSGPQTAHFYGIPIFAYKTPRALGDTVLREERDDSGGANASLALGLAWQVRSSTYRTDKLYRSHTTDSPFPSWTWAAFKASHPQHGLGLLKFPFRMHSVSQSDSAINVRVRHVSGDFMTLNEYMSHEDDYTNFQPFVDLASLVVSGTLSRDHIGAVAFSAFPHVPLHLHESFESISGKVRAVYVGIVEKVMWDGEAVFLLVEENTHRIFDRTSASGIWEHRLVGVCSHRISIDGVGKRAAEWTKVLESHLHVSEGRKWHRQTLRLV